MKRRIPVRDEHRRVRLNPERPPHEADDEVMEGAGIAAGEEHHEPADQAEDGTGDVQKEEHDVVRDSEEPFHQGEPSVESASSSPYGTSTSLPVAAELSSSS